MLTGVGLEHTRWLGPTITDIATEKADVVRPGGTLVVGPDLAPGRAAPSPSASAPSAARGSSRRRRPATSRSPPKARSSAATSRSHGPRRRRCSASSTRRRRRRRRVDARARAASRSSRDEPVTVFDGAHNPDGMRALADALRDFLDGRRARRLHGGARRQGRRGDAARAGCRCATSSCSRAAANPRALPPATLASLCRQLGGPPARVVSEPHDALAAARELAGPDGVALATGLALPARRSAARARRRARSTL